MDAHKMGCFIAQRRKELGSTQSELAEKLHVTDKAVSRWERGVGLPDINLIEPLAQALEVSLVELVQAKYAEREIISLNEAEKIVADTIKLSKNEKTAKMIGTAILGVFGIVCAFLLVLLITDGSIVMYSVGSLVAGLIAWGAPIWHMTLARSRKTAIPAAVSLGAALVSLAIQFFQLAHEVDTRDFAAIEDTIHALCLVVVLFSATTVILNLLMVLKANKE